MYWFSRSSFNALSPSQAVSTSNPFFSRNRARRLQISRSSSITSIRCIALHFCLHIISLIKDQLFSYSNTLILLSGIIANRSRGNSVIWFPQQYFVLVFYSVLLQQMDPCDGYDAYQRSRLKFRKMISKK